ncbi:MAG: SMP-30/gluconolactonase/LRE family protein [Blastocatellia bacterium]
MPKALLTTRRFILLTLLLVSASLTLAAQSSLIIRSPAGSGAYGFGGDNNPAANALLATPSGVAVDGDGNMFIADTYNNRIRKVNAAGVITTYAGTGIGGYTGDGGQATIARIDTPIGIAVDRSGNVYFSDSLNDAVRKVDTTGKITTVAGNGQSGFSGDGGQATAARLSLPQSLIFDGAGNLYICDTFNNRVRKVDTQGIITTIAGNGSAGYSGDGGLATQAKLDTPDGVAVDRLGNVYIADTQNFVVRKVDTSGKISTYAGNGIDGYGGDNGAALQANLSPIRGLAVDASGNLYIGDPGNDRIRRVDTKGKITTVAGNGSTGYNGDAMTATQAWLNEPIGISIDPYGVLYFTDSYGDRVRVLKSNQLQMFSLSQYVIQPTALPVALKITGTGFENATVGLNGQAAVGTIDGPTGNLSVNVPGAMVNSSGTVILRVTAAGGATFDEKTLVIATSTQLNSPNTTSVSGASYQAVLCPEMITSLFGLNLATQVQGAASLPLPTSLAGTRVFVNGTAAPLFYVSPTQVNYMIPAAIAPDVSVNIVNVAGNGIVSQQQTRLTSDNPGVFTANASGTGGPAAQWTMDGVAQFNVTNPDGSLNAIPVGAYLILYGTGIRRAPDPTTDDNNGVAEVMQANFEGIIAPVAYGGLQGTYVGLDQVNLQIPVSLAGRGAMNLVIVVNGKAANTVKVKIQ